MSTHVFAQSQTCFDKVKIEPGFIAVTTKKDSELGDWYQRIFGLKIAKAFSFPGETTTGVLMQNGEFVVEVFYREDALEPGHYVQDSSADQWQGFFKFGVYTDANLALLRQCLQELGVNAGRIFNDENLGIDLLQVIDPEENVLEIISRAEED